MKYFRKHPDLLIITNYPAGGHRIRHGRHTTPQQLSKLLVNTTTTLSPNKKILLLTDASDDNAWDIGKPQSIFRLIGRLIYNHETRTVCILYHPELFGRFWTDVITPGLIALLRLSGKEVMTVFLTTPKLSVQPTLAQTCCYFLRFTLTAAMTICTNTAVVGEKPFAHKLIRLTDKKTILTIPMTFRTLKERRHAGEIVSENLFPSPTHNLRLIQ